MPLIRLLQIVTATLAALGTMLLGMGQREVGMTLLVILAAGLSVWLTDVKGWVYLNRNVANLIMLATALFSLRDLFHIYSEIQALTFAQFLIYLQIILLFQKKDGRTYWLLIMLSLLQVVVAALFSQGVFFGFMLVAYMLLASFALTLLMLDRQSEPSRYRSPGFFPWSRRAGAQAGKTDAAKAEKGRPAARWPLTDKQTEFEGAPAGSSRQGVGGELLRRLAGMSARTLGLTMVLFVVVPRFGQVGWSGGFAQPQPIVGFGDRVTLGEMGQIIESPSEVMRIRFFEGKTDKPYAASGEIYLYGGVLMDYHKGGWKVGKPGFSMGEMTMESDPNFPKSFVRQECTIEALDRPELFFIPPFGKIAKNHDIIIEDAKLRLIRAAHRQKQNFNYRLGATAFRNGVQSPLNPIRAGENLTFKNSLQLPQENGRGSLPKLEALAKEWIEASKLPETDTLGRARYLESKLASGLYKYSLEGQVRDPSMDPIEDFLKVHPVGHCEYFATALALMLRSQKIHSRLVVGFKCDEWNELGQCYQVRQLHAHTWVEAWLKPDQLPKEYLHGEGYWPWKIGGGWLRLDPTPAGGAEEGRSIFSPIADALQWLDFAWSYYVVELNYERQRRAIFTPIAEAARKTFDAVRNPKTWRDFYERIGEALHRSGAAGGAAWALLILAAAAGLAILSLLGYLLWRGGRKLWRSLAARRARRRRGPRIEVEFYRRFELMLAKNGLSRPLGQTPREFAGAAGAWLAAETGEGRLTPLPARIVEAYYRVRFGCLPLDGNQSQEVEQMLKDVDLRRGKRKKL
ncbi:MAG: DUF3488 domain-containing protein [Pirellulales bacterium]|nr:DUF3488 domain-containing protein [Pirellulales bacterium]